jgi:DNA-binding MarR family transcriptional regulator
VIGQGADTRRRVRTGRRTAEDIESSEVVDAGTVACNGPAQEAWLQMREISHPPGLLEAGGKLAEEMGVTPGVIRALRPLANAEALTMSGLAAQLRCDGSYVTGLIDTLEEAGLAERQSDARDRRVKFVALTEKGREVARRACEVVSTPPAGISALSPRELDQLVRLLRKIQSAG